MSRTSTSHTPGPWGVNETRGEDVHESYDSGIVFEVNGDLWPGLALVAGVDKVGEANARLIAAAPELLAVVRVLADLDWCIGYELSEAQMITLDNARDAAHAAIAKAEGR